MLETSFIAHTHILPATLETFSLALSHTHTSFYARDIFSCTYTHTSCTYFLGRYIYIYTSFLALTHVLDATLETAFLAHTYILPAHTHG